LLTGGFTRIPGELGAVLPAPTSLDSPELSACSN
jgi:hypothetical protein